MTEQGFSEDQYLRQMIEYTIHHDDYSRSAFVSGGRYYGRYLGTDVFIPLGVKQYSYDFKEMSYLGPRMLYWAYRNAEFFRWSLVDESIPLQGNDVVFGIFDGCRRTNAIALWMLKYWPALPELREAMLHDYDSYLRQLCVETISIMGQRGARFTKDIRESIRNFNGDPYYQSEAVKALARLNDREAVPLLCDLYEEARDRIDRLSFEEAMKKETGSMMLIDKITSALIKLHPQRAREILAMELADPNPHVRYLTKRAFQLSPLQHELELMESSCSFTIGSLPADPRWAFQRQMKL